MKKDLKIEWISKCVKTGDYYLSKHGDEERKNDNLEILEIEEVLLTGRILEYYPNTGRGDSLLLAGFTENGKPLHIVCGKRGNSLVVVTVYIPKPPKFKNLYERG